MSWIPGPAKYLIVFRFSFFSRDKLCLNYNTYNLMRALETSTMNEPNQKTPSDVCRYTFLHGRICFVLNRTNTPSHRASSDVGRYAFLPSRICFVTEFCLVLLCWREVAFSNYQIVHGFAPPPFFHPDSLQCCYLRHESALSVSA